MVLCNNKPYTYDAAGNKLKKVSQENNATVPFNNVNYTSNITTTTTYIEEQCTKAKHTAIPLWFPWNIPMCYNLWLMKKDTAGKRRKYDF